MRNWIAERFRGLEPSLMMKMFKEAEGRSDVINLSLGEPDVPTDPSIVEAAYRAGLNGDTHYAPSAGFSELRHLIRDYWDQKYRLSYSPQEVLVTTGGSQACHLAFQALLNPGEEVLLLEPYFTFYEQQVRYHGGVPKPVLCAESNGFMPSLEDIEKAVTPRTKALVLNSPCNPTGAVFDRATLEGIAHVAEKYDLVVISDELYEAFVYEGIHTPFATLPEMQKRTLTIGGFSKSYAMCGWRIGYAMGPQEIIRTMDYLAIVQTLSVNSMVQRAACFALKEGEGIQRSLVALFRDRVAYAARKIEAIPQLSCVHPKGSFYLFVNIEKTGLEGETFAWRLLGETGVIVIPGLAFGPDCRYHVRIACTVPNEVLGEACDRIAAFLSHQIP